ncbi:hypothetical protein PHYSODRAFT_295312 [Phytophthora sojae]|uniref:Uncharacterized protein n=1 Tax=Phytophthora sojae (strain P6497) TaxID=1094619 RepID=G4YNP8_PHYSP|nr:hypothetical protein PHYSODRAFT_295312 [Phytophthora sojae]EGZ30553.1 hypothetical protein PHYSODRAFT_295312 [Phytophthora sojae]|eukprot:XP_009517828.1 hypothetical protein PHYSODRAFT_295312 [Phytophthora sojae]
MEHTPSAALQEQVNSAEDALKAALVRAAQACKAGFEEKERLLEVTGPLKSADEAALPTTGEDDEVYCRMDRETYYHLIAWTNAEQAAFANAEVELLEAKLQHLHLTALVQSDLTTEERARLSGVLESAQLRITQLWVITKERQEQISCVQEILRGARRTRVEVDRSE